MASRIVFRLDASVALGSGHLARCLTLADYLRGIGEEVLFVCRRMPSVLLDLITGAGHAYAILELPGLEPELLLNAEQQREDAERFLQHCGGDVEWVVVDHYGLSSVWETRVAEALGCRVLVIDDLANRPHTANLLLDTALDVGEDDCRYRDRVNSACKLLLGPRYALMKETFSRLRESVVVRDGEVRVLLISLGGTDPDNITSCVLKAIDDLHFSTVHVVVGAANAHLDSIRRVCVKKGYIFHCQTNRMAELIALSDLAIGACGVSIWERCCLGLPSIVFQLAPNQETLAVNAERMGLVHLIRDGRDTESLRNCIASFAANKHAREAMSRRCLEHLDPYGAERVMMAMGRYVVEIAVATFAHAKQIWEWRNSPQVRIQSHNSDYISFDDHLNWYQRVMADPCRHLLIGQFRGNAIGVVRFDCQQEAATVSIYLKPGLEGRGWGKLLLEAGESWLSKHVGTVRHLIAEVKDGNAASHRLFLGAKYQLANGFYTKVMS